MTKAAHSDTHVHFGTNGRRTVTVSKATVTAARGRVYIASKLGRSVSKVTAKIANAR
jgi:hypothetical protein